MAQDLTHSLEALFDASLTWQDFVLWGVRLGDAPDAIPLDKIKHTSMDTPPVGASGITYKNDKAYYKLAGVEHEFLLAERIKNIYERNGWVLLTGGARFRILNRQVVEFRLAEELLHPIQNTPFLRIEKRFGRADKKLVWVEPVDALYTTTTFIYVARQLRVTYDDNCEAINGINIGASLIEEYQAALQEGTTHITAPTDYPPQKKLTWWRALFNAR